ncbi:P-loop containing nucleoside triphosphate hydrolase protein [Clohesyomyces aquaticus]|uniref:p-loop containing nucleoside triphosphate hydrolase protein n=1 Tax=Clohesyomyces aquaticus TaxID=1231657 RepID=A0A1Y2AB91_9PLEO|nr:P-loop containing nucleoside triphosphate hydrolase protein [Clohesyomyces aquaticus]
MSSMATPAEYKINLPYEKDQGQGQDEEEQESIHRGGWKALFGFTTKKHLPVLCVGVLCATIAALVLPAMSILFGLIFRQFTDFASGNTAGKIMLENISRYCLYLTALGAVNWLANSIYFPSILIFGDLQAKSARNRIFNALLRKDMDWYDTRDNGIAAFLPGVQMQVRDLQLSCSGPIGECIQCCVSGIGALSIALYFSWNLTLVIICAVPFVYMFMAFLSSRLSKQAHEQADQLQLALKYVTSAVSSIETVKCFNGQSFELQKYASVIARTGRLYNRQANLRSIQIGFMQFITYSMFVQGFWYGSRLVITGKKSPGEVTTTFWGALMAVQGITGFLPQFIVLQKGKVAGARLLATIARISNQETDPKLEEGQKPYQCAGAIEFKKVTFLYPSRPDQPALQDASVFFPSGETSFVVGRSGSGKSTLGQLIVRFYEPTAGSISIDGVPLADINHRWLRQNITLVEQHSVLFNDTVRHNIALAKECNGASQEEVQQAVEFALLEQTIRDLPDGLETWIGPKGNSMSGGQKQRIALARARLRDTPVLILDESTSALDRITRSTILEAIRIWRRGKTTIVITHDISQILPDDYVYILDHAQLVQEGHRRSVEARPNSVFNTSISGNVTETGDEEAWPDNETDEILSFYSTAHVPPKRRPSAPAVVFGEQLQSPLLSPLARDGLTPETLLAARSRQGSVATPGPRNNLNANLGRSESRSFDIRRSHERRSISRPRASSRVSVRGRSRTPSHGPPKRHGSPRRVSIKEPPTRCSGNLEKEIHLDGLARASQADQLEDSLEGRIPGFKALTIRQILATTWPNLGWDCRLTLCAAFACAVVHAGCTPAFAYVFAKLLSTFFSASDRQRMAMIYATAILGIGIVDGLATWGFHFLFDYCAQAWVNALRTEAMQRILDQPREFFDRDENSVARIAECLDHFAEEARNLLGRFAGISVVVAVMILIAIVWSLMICWKLTLVALATGPIMYATTACYNAISGLWAARSNEADENVGEVLYETFTNIRTVRALVLEEVFRRKFSATTKAALMTGLKRAIYSGPIFGLNYAAIIFVAAFLFWFGAKLASTNEVATTNVLQTFTILLLSASQINFIVMYIPQISTAKDAGTRLLRFANLPQDSHEHRGNVELRKAEDLVLNDLNFAYPMRKGHQVLHEVNINIPPGSCTAIVGPSGSGKSTIAALLLRLYETNSHYRGRLGPPGIMISNRDINILHTDSLRSRIAVVSQTPVLFPGTIAENIAYGSDSASPRAMDQILQAAAAAGIAEFISGLPQGYYTLVGEGGTGLSGGQAQRVSIARALMRKPDVLILDEATSALDAESAAIIRDTVRRLVAQSRNGGGGKEKRDMTVLIITHAREMMAIAEHVIMLDKGRVVEEGGFDELKKKRGPFAGLLRGGGADMLDRGRK